VPVQTAQAYPFGVQTGTTTSTNTGFPSGGFPVINYEPTGLTLKFTPQVFPNQDVQVKMSIESKDVLGASTLTPTFTERTITGTARVQNNRTMMLASVSQDVQTNGRRGLPVLGGLPIIGRLFSSPTRDNRQVDIVIAVTPRVLRAPAVTPRDEEMRPSGTLQSPTTGSLEAMLREADREDQLAEWRLQQKNNTAKVSTPVSAPGVFPNSASPTATNVVAQTAGADNGNAVALNSAAPAAPRKTVAPAEELPAYVPAPKSLVSNTAANEVAAVNTNLTSDAHAVLTSLAKPIETAFTNLKPGARSALLSLTPGEQSMRVGETRRFSLELRSDVSPALGIIALRYDPKVVKLHVVSAGSLLANEKGGASFSESVDATGLCLLSISNLGGKTLLNGGGTLLFIDVEGVGSGDAGLLLDKDSINLVGADARNLAVEVVPVRASVKQ
jgi:general secretion pathway protein D